MPAFIAPLLWHALPEGSQAGQRDEKRRRHAVRIARHLASAGVGQRRKPCMYVVLIKSYYFANAFANRNQSVWQTSGHTSGEKLHLRIHLDNATSLCGRYPIVGITKANKRNETIPWRIFTGRFVKLRFVLSSIA